MVESQIALKGRMSRMSIKWVMFVVKSELLVNSNILLDK